MGERIARSAIKAGVASDAVPILLRAYAVAMAPRDSGPRALPTDQHPAFLHPGRTVLILLDDLGETDPRILAVGALAESRDTELRVRRKNALRALEGLGDTEEEAFGWWKALPRLDWSATEDEKQGTGEDFLERLVTASEPLQQVVLAEALDHLRHAHLWPSRSDQLRALELAESVLKPVADRTHPALERRYSWWTRRVGQSLRSVRE